jgi:uncharacterized membrane protein
LSWGLSFRLRRYVDESLWVLPVLGGTVGSLLGIAVANTGTILGLPPWWKFSAGTSEAVLATVVGASVGLAGFVVTVTVLIVQMVGGTLSPRYMRLFYRDGALKLALAVLVTTMTFAYSLLRRVEEGAVPSFGVSLAGFLLAAGVILFLVFLDRSVHRLRPVAVAELVARAGRRSHEEATRLAGTPDAPTFVSGAYETVGDPTLEVRSSRAGAIQAIDTRGLTRFARTHTSLVVLPRAVGDFVPEGSALVQVFGGVGLGETAARQLRSMVALGPERTIEQDPAFAIRVMVDIAIRALSPAVNDPTTAVQILNHLGDTLRLVGSAATSEADGVGTVAPGVIVPVRRWEDVLALAITEIRQFGESSVQVMRRLRALLEELRETVPAARRAAVDDELARLNATLGAYWGESVDLDRAARPDRQGLGGPTAAAADGRLS